MSYKILNQAILPDGTHIQLEDWSENNTLEFPDLYGLQIGAYPVAKNGGCYGLVRKNEIFRLTISMNKYRNYTNEMVKTDYEALKSGSKSLIDLQDYYYNADKDKYYMGILSREIRVKDDNCPSINGFIYE